MSEVVSAVAFVLRGCLALAMAVLLEGLIGSIVAAANGASPPSLLQPWRELRRLARMQALLPEGASAVVRYAPAVAASATLAAAMLAPSFAGTSHADLPMIAGLLGLAGLAHAMALADGGAAFGGAVAARGMVASALALPALIVLILFAGLSGGGEASAIVLAGCAAGALAFVACGDPARDADARVWSGIDLALVRSAGSLRTVTILTVLASGFFSVGPDSDVASWLAGLAVWIQKVTLLGVTFGLVRARFSATVPTRPLIGIAAIAGLLALLTLLARQVSV